MEIGERFGLFWKAFFSPEKVFAAEAKGKSSMADGALNNVLAFLIVPIIFILVSLIGPGADVVSGVVVGLVALVALLILSFIIAALYHFVAGLLGGKGRLENTYYLLSIYNGMGVFSSIVMVVLYLIAIGVTYAAPVAAIVVLPVAVVLLYTVMAYMYYMLGIAVKSAHGVSSLKGIFSFMVAVGIVVAVALAVLFAIFGGVMLGAETRARANVWATACLTGALIAILIVVVAQPVLQTIYGDAGTIGCEAVSP